MPEEMEGFEQCLPDRHRGGGDAGLRDRPLPLRGRRDHQDADGRLFRRGASGRAAPRSGQRRAERRRVVETRTSRARTRFAPIYRSPNPRSVAKEITHLDPHCRRFVELSPFVVLGSSGASGEDVSPRGGPPGFVKVLDGKTLVIPDFPGNNRLDSLENILETGRVGLLFLVPGVDETLARQRACDDRRRSGAPGDGSSGRPPAARR